MTAEIFINQVDSVCDVKCNWILNNNEFSEVYPNSYFVEDLEEGDSKEFYFKIVASGNSGMHNEILLVNCKSYGGIFCTGESKNKGGCPKG